MNEMALNMRGPAISVKTVADTLTFTRGVGLRQWLTTPLEVQGGGTVGQHNRKWLHEKLDQWIETQLIEVPNGD